MYTNSTFCTDREHTFNFSDCPPMPFDHSSSTGPTVNMRPVTLVVLSWFNSGFHQPRNPPFTHNPQIPDVTNWPQIQATPHSLPVTASTIHIALDILILCSMNSGSVPSSPRCYPKPQCTLQNVFAGLCREILHPDPSQPATGPKVILKYSSNTPQPPCHLPNHAYGCIGTLTTPVQTLILLQHQQQLCITLVDILAANPCPSQPR